MAAAQQAIVPMVLHCPKGHQHIDEGEWATRPHKTHKCTFIYDIGDIGFGGFCGEEWRPKDFPTVGVPASALDDARQKPDDVCECDHIRQDHPVKYCDGCGGCSEFRLRRP